MATRYGLHNIPDRRMTGLVFVLLILGQHAVLVQENLEFGTPYAHGQALQNFAAQQREDHRTEFGLTRETLTMEIASRGLGDTRTKESFQGTEVMRGYLDYLCDEGFPWQRWKTDWPVIVRQGNEAGQAVIEFYETQDHTKFSQGLPMDVPPSRTFTLGMDSLVGANDKEKTLKVHGVWQKRGKKVPMTKTLKVTRKRPFLFVRKTQSNKKGQNEQIPWLKFADDDGVRVKELLNSWMDSLNVIKALGTPLSEGRSLLQCTFDPTSKTCSSAEFCTLKDQQRCEMVSGASNVREAWGKFKSRVAETMAKINNTDYCMYGCQNEWKSAAADFQILESLKKNLPTAGAMSGIPSEMQTVVAEVQQSAGVLAGLVVKTLSDTFDYNRKDVTTPLGMYLWISPKWTKSCDKNLTDGSVERLLRASPEQADEEKEMLKRDLQTCPWLEQIKATSEDSDGNSLSRIEQNIKRELAPSDKSTSLLSIEPLTITLIVIVVLIVVGILMMVLGPLACAGYRKLTEKDTPEAKCKARESQGTCSMVVSNIGVVMLWLGLIVLVVLVIIILLVALFAGDGGSGGGPGPGLGWGWGWYYMAPVYMPPGPSGPSLEEPKAFDFQLCVNRLKLKHQA